jgi:diguanylate cyclase (GGDEF)-like protein
MIAIRSPFGWHRRAAPAPARTGPQRITVDHLKNVLGVLTCLLVVASAVTSYFITERQTALNQVSRYNATFVVSIAPVEVMRLETAIAESGMVDSPTDIDQIQLRLDIVRNRISLLHNSEISDFIRENPDTATIVDRLKVMADDVQLLIDNFDPQKSPILMLKRVSPMSPLLVRLAAMAHAYSSNLVTRDHAQLSRLHSIFSLIIGGLTICGFGLLGIVTWHNRLLRQAHSEVNLLVRNLQDRDSNLQTQNSRFAAALSNMSQALCMADQDQRVIVCNVRFLDLFHLTEEMVHPGTPVEAVFRNIIAAGHYQEGLGCAIAKQQRSLIAVGRTGNFYQENGGGQAIAVSHQPMPDGGWVATYEDVSERRQAEARIHFMAHHDALTRLPNRVLFEERLRHALQGARRGDQGAAVLCLDLDHFKNVNDTLGHPAGDKLLRLVAQRLLDCVRDSDTVARFGGDEFAILQTAADQPEHAEALASRLIDAIGAPYDLDGTRVVIGTSIGIAIAGDGSLEDWLQDPSTMLKNADTALYRAKARQRETYCFFVPEMDAQLQSRRALELDLREAIARSELTVFYQPLFDLSADVVTGFEALLRWRHPAKGMISPAIFIPIAEEIGLIGPIGEWVLNEACRQAATWPAHFKVAVNLSPIQFQTDNLVQVVCASLEMSGLLPSQLELEITESALLRDSEKVLSTLHELRNLGIAIALDDFGTGYSSLSYLRSFPFDRIKIDQSFVREMGRRDDCLAIVQSVAQLAQKLGMATTAEGVETLEQLRQIREVGCTHAQGYHFDRPKPAAEITGWFGHDAVRGPARQGAYVAPANFVGSSKP